MRHLAELSAIICLREVVNFSQMCRILYAVRSFFCTFVAVGIAVRTQLTRKET